MRDKAPRVVSPAKDQRKSLGRMGEDAVCGYLKDSGFEILDRNFRTSLGEIDIVARKGRLVVFVEVKTRKSVSAGFEGYSQRQIRRMIELSQAYVAEHDFPVDYDLRFDVIVVTGGEGRAARVVEHIEDAFRP